MNELIREIEEDMRRERAERLWTRFGRMMVMASIGVIVATIIVVAWQEHKRSEAAVETGLFLKGIDRMNAGDYKSANLAFSQLASDSDSPYGAMALLRKAQGQELSGDKEGAALTYHALASRQGVFSDLAVLLSAKASDAPMTAHENSPFYFSQSEWRGWQLLSQHKTDEALAQFKMLAANDNAPKSLSERAKLAAQYIEAGK